MIAVFPWYPTICDFYFPKFVTRCDFASAAAGFVVQCVAVLPEVQPLILLLLLILFLKLLIHLPHLLVMLPQVMQLGSILLSHQLPPRLLGRRLLLLPLLLPPPRPSHC
jgi:hypothetical protein